MKRLFLLAGIAFSVASFTHLSSAEAATLYALGDDGRLTTIDTTSQKVVRSTVVKNAPGLKSIALRPADGKLYGIGAAGIVRIDPMTGAAMAVSSFDKPVDTGARAAISFNPTVDRLRVTGPSGNNYRINVDTGAVTVDSSLKYGPTSPLSGTKPGVTAAAYTNSFAGTKETALYTIDPMLAQLNLQAPPNDGMQLVKGELGMSPPYGLGFAILSDGQGGNEAFAVMGGNLGRVDLASGRVTLVGAIAGMAAGEVPSAAVMK